MAVSRFFQFLFFLLAFFFWACSGDNLTETASDEIVEDTDSREESSTSMETTSSTTRDFPVIFTEVDPINIDFKDHEGGDAGWVELYNISGNPVNLKDYYLTDSKDNLRQWKFGNAVILPKHFMLVFLSGKNYPDYVAPHDSTDMIGPGCWDWTDSQNEPVAGYSYASPLYGNSRICYTEQGKRHVGVNMKFGSNEELGWTSIAVMVGTGSTAKTDTRDVSAANELLLTGYINKGKKLSVRLTQPDMDDWLGYEIVFTGTGERNKTYKAILPTGTTFPDLKKIYGTRFSPGGKEIDEVQLDISSYIVRNRGHEPHTSFKADKDGGSLFLVSPEGKILDNVNYPKMSSGKAWTLANVGTDLAAWGYGYPTPGEGFVGNVVSSVSPSIDGNMPASGFYSNSFTINFSANSNVRCEQGGYVPTKNSPLMTTFVVNRTTVLRCASFVSGKEPSAVESRTYIFEKQPTIASVFITGNPLSFFDPDTGIYMDGPNAQIKDPHFGANYWADRELPVFVELQEANAKSPNFAENAGFQIFGNYSRAQAKKSVAIVFREQYGKKRLKYTLFPEFPALKEFKGFVLRNNGGNGGLDYIRDRLASSLSEGLGVDYQRGRPAIVFYNGEYFGIHNIRERSNEHYFETHYGYDAESIDLLKADNSPTNGSASDYNSLMDWLESNHLDSEKNYNYVASKIDVSNLINYMHTEVFANNRDWPSNNLKKWRCNSPKTLWKWFLYDMDFGFGNSMSEYTNNIFDFITAEDGPDWPNGPKSTFLFRRMFENEGFKNAFVNRFMALFTMNFSGSRITAKINSMMSEISSEVSRDQKRWDRSASYMSMNLQDMKDFAVTRQSVLTAEMQEHFSLGSATSVKLSVSGSGKILVHDLPLEQTSMTIDFFEGTPVTLTAQPSSGCVFAGWSDGDKNQTRIILPEMVESLSATFK